MKSLKDYTMFEKAQQKGSHARWKHPYGRATTIPIHGKSEIGNWLFYEILKQLGITEEEFEQLRFPNISQACKSRLYISNNIS